MDRAQKAEQVEALHAIFTGASSLVVSHYAGLTVAQMTELRIKAAESGARFKVIKNRLAKRALEGTSKLPISDLLTGPVGIAYSEDPVAAPKVAVEFAKKNEKLVILGGMMDETVLDVDGVKALATLPSLDELRGKIVGLLNAPATKVAGVLQAPAGQLARVLGAYASKDEAA